MFTKQIQRLFHILIICTWTQLARGTTYQTGKHKINRRQRVYY